jgi:hypothetical protein
MMEKREYKGMHGGSVKGKSFEATRRDRKTHTERRTQRAVYERALAGIK